MTNNWRKQLEVAGAHRGYGASDLFPDFVNMSACALSCGQREPEYLQTVKRHDKQTLSALAECFATFIDAADGMCDFENRKTQTRRLPSWHQLERVAFDVRENEHRRSDLWVICHVAKGDILYVREAWANVSHLFHHGKHGQAPGVIAYRADKSIIDFRKSPATKLTSVYDFMNVQWQDIKWKPSIFMPRWASRIHIKVKNIRVEKLRDITHEDALCEGMEPLSMHGLINFPRDQFQRLWDDIHQKKEGCSWRDNPLVYVIDFKRLKPEAFRLIR